ncbi:hypothetical protein MTR67_036872 [Solanum verrucosum]|uniref:Bifunctional inhibitor/plant lipid transfer protein/seed storage helical domain-containing protein n=1 Tax=Solanum verrucosum TaxID=315347 RepID=A0AAF0ZLI3_SOLVR|nr:hypothetical protein MTR67_036872 [Solanum verrucosum]
MGYNVYGEVNHKIMMNKMIWSMVLVVILLYGLEIKIVKGEVSESVCREERSLGKKACLSVLFGSNPSAKCCERARVTHWECLCPIVTPKLVAMINPKRIIRLIQGCGRTVPRNFKCGSIRTPP